MSGADLRLGRWQDVLEGEECDALICDPPYGQRTHEGHDSANNQAPGMFPNKLGYEHWTAGDVGQFVDAWAPRVSGWLVAMTSHDLVPAWEATLAAAGRYTFAPLPYLDPGKAPRVLGDGPASWTVHIIVSRPRDGAWLKKWRADRKDAGLSRSLPGAYVRSAGDVVWDPPRRVKAKKRMGGKPPAVMRAIVRDYSRPGDIVCDPFAGHGTTLLAALTEGRRAIGAEVDPIAHAAACARLDCGYTPDMFAGLPMVGGPTR